MDSPKNWIGILRPAINEWRPKKYLIEQRFGHFFVYPSTYAVDRQQSINRRRRLQNELAHGLYLPSTAIGSKDSPRNKWHGGLVQHRPTPNKLTGKVLQGAQLLSALSKTDIILWRSRSGAKEANVIMATQVFKKRIYKVIIKTHFVLRPSIEIQNQIQVIYLNLIYDWTAEARNWTIQLFDFFLIASLYSIGKREKERHSGERVPFSAYTPKYTKLKPEAAVSNFSWKKLPYSVVMCY